MNRYLLLLPAFVFGAVNAQAGLITTAPAGGTTSVFAGGSTCAGGTDAGFTITVVVSPVCWPASQSFGLTNNGYWDNPTTGFGYIGVNSGTGAFMINLGGLYSAVGGFINYNSAVVGSDPTITALAANGTTVLGTYDISVLDPINTPAGSNAGAFVGIQDATADIAYLELSGDFIVIHSITLAPNASTVPEPSSLVLLGSALVAIVAGRYGKTKTR